MHNGHFVLANGSGPSSPAPTPQVNGGNGVNGVIGGHMADSAVEDATKSRPMIKYKDAEASNLIDLY